MSVLPTFLTVGVACYNDAKTLPTLVGSVVDFLSTLDIGFRVFVVDDGSQDDSWDVIGRLKERYGQVSSLRNPVNQGFGPTLKSIFTLSETEWILYLPGDDQFPVQEIQKMLIHMEEYDFIIGRRIDRAEGLYRRALSGLYNKLVSLLFGHQVSDVNSIVLFRAVMTKQFQLESRSAFIHAELYIRAMQYRLRFVEVDVTHRKRKFGEAHGGRLNTIINALFEMIGFWFKQRPKPAMGW